MRCVLMMFLLYLPQATLLAACPTDAQRFVISGDGNEVTDRYTGLNWARCDVGQNWDGKTCAGTPKRFDLISALQYAKSQANWRLPNVKELVNIVDYGCVHPAFDRTAFPNIHYTMGAAYWTSTPATSEEENTIGARWVGASDGSSSATGIGDKCMLKLVRRSPR